MIQKKKGENKGTLKLTSDVLIYKNNLAFDRLFFTKIFSNEIYKNGEMAIKKYNL